MREATATRRVILHPSLIKPMLVGGAEREAVFALWFVCLGTSVMAGILFIPVGIVVGGVGQFFLRQMASRDPQAIGVTRRHWGQQNFYPGRATFFAPGYRPTGGNGPGFLVRGVSSVMTRLLGGTQKQKKEHVRAEHQAIQG
ncbi:VirB3 family type IV secretion system protein [Acidithiobacillus albertensis]|uniref:VirB3 family type IV secretion system protein n=1 Tax=Acidithiobacillus albertensis TaxID=119978 RepID=UPI00094AB8A4|nr:VirB3 family type IV secretion system protein [Acidithiobacillus albertensis]